MYINKIGFNIDWKRKTMHVYIDNDEVQKVEIDSEGDGILSIDLFKTIQIGSLKRFIEELRELVSKEQMIAVLSMWGSSTAIKIGVLSDLLQDRELAKAVLRLGSQRGVIAVGVNSTWKVINKEEQKTMKEYAERAKKGMMTREVSFEQIDSLSKSESSLEGEAGSEVRSKTDSKLHNEVNKGIVYLTEKTDKKVTESIKNNEVHLESLQKELKALEKRLAENKDWNEEETPHTVVNKINAIKAQLRLNTSPQATTSLPSKVLPVKKPLTGKLPTRKPKP